MKWHRRFWEEPQAQAEFDYWTKVPAWSPEEIVALSLSKDPRFVSSEKFVQSTRGTEFSATYFERLEIVQRHQAAGELDDRTRSTRVIEWAEEYDFALPQELVEMVRKVAERRAKKLLITNLPSTAVTERALVEEAVWREVQTRPADMPQNVDDPGNTVEDNMPTPEPSESGIRMATNAHGSPSKMVKKTPASAHAENPDLLGIREQKNMQIMLAVIAIKMFQFDRNAPRNGAIQKVIKHLKAYGVPLSKGTVLKNLRAAAHVMEERLEKTRGLEKARRRQT
ncbi:MAG: hypothetical protein O9333_13605 [Beijerinckiaceae bacterium]|nr:hypothetical protein [Beijerinckiaceae bacterium]